MVKSTIAGGTACATTANSVAPKVGQAVSPAVFSFARSQIRRRWICLWATTLVTLLAGCTREKPLPVLGEIPQFELLNQQGRKFERASLNGHVWVADFIFTNCESSCPRMSSKMHSIQGATGADVRLVSFSVDPGRDTPQALAEYGKKYSADEKRWTFLTGNPATLEMLDHDAFKLGSLSMDHSTRFVLVDKKGHVRGYYGLFDGDAVTRLEKDAARLDKEQG